MLRSAPRCVRLQRPALTSRIHVRPVFFPRPPVISHLNRLLPRQAFHTRSILRERTAVPEQQQAKEDPAPSTPPPAQDAGAPAPEEEPAAAAADDGEQAAETAEGAAGEEAAAGDAAAGAQILPFSSSSYID